MTIKTKYSCGDVVYALFNQVLHMDKVVQIDIRLPDKSELYTIDWITVHMLSSKVPMDGVMNKEEAMHYILDINGRKYLELFS